LLDENKKIGFFKPIIAGSKPTETDSDVAFMKDILNLKESADLLSPVFSDESRLKGNIKEAYAKVSKDKDVVLIECSDLAQASHTVTEALNARVIIVADYSVDIAKALKSAKDFGKNMLGIVINKVPKSHIEQVREDASAQLDKGGVKLIGVLPEDRTLLVLTIDELANSIQGEILRGAEKSAELVENVMLGALTVDTGPYYYNRKDNKAVILKSERADMQMAALETSTRCLVLAGDEKLQSIVLAQAEEKDVPIITVTDDITSVVTKIEGLLGKIRFNQGNKLPRLNDIMGQHFDFAALSKRLA
jgi:BioD-like phosphotransacetylase family protein